MKAGSKMAVAKRKRRGGPAFQAKKLKRNEKDAKTPAKPSDVAEEAAEAERDRIPGPVCKVGEALRPWFHAPLLGLCGFPSCRGVSGARSHVSRRDPLQRLHLTLVHVAAVLEAAG